MGLMVFTSRLLQRNTKTIKQKSEQKPSIDVQDELPVLDNANDPVSHLPLEKFDQTSQIIDSDEKNMTIMSDEKCESAQPADVEDAEQTADLEETGDVESIDEDFSDLFNEFENR